MADMLQKLEILAHGRVGFLKSMIGQF